ncbi:MAG: glutamate 5-kinase [Candidatus Omnitrophica bacterium]|nr:glutamate 5-kinase [Candidatus Omnitrophota bacterium]
MRQSGKDCKRIVIKIGSSLLYSGAGKIDLSFLNEITRQISDSLKDEKELVIVSSGAIAMGMSVLGLQARPGEVSALQAAAAIGQNEMMNIYRRAFAKLNLVCAQVLLTWEDFNDRKRYLNARNTLLTLLKLNSLPIINENDTVSTDEIRFGDNDRLSALVATLINADLLIILSDVDGLLDKDKKMLIKVVDEITPQIKALASSTQRNTSVGGMITKIQAVEIAVKSGIPCVIANGRRHGVILSAINEPGKEGTLFIPRKGSLCARERWIAFGTKTKGKITVDDGARRALANKKSLLSVGVVSTTGAFDAGDIVGVYDLAGNEFARGKAGISHKQLDKVKGSRFDKEVIHRDNIVIL